MFWPLYFLLKTKVKFTALVTEYLRQVNQTHFSCRNYFSIFVLRRDVFKLIKTPFIKIKKLMLTNFTLVMYLQDRRKILMSGAIPILTYLQLSYLLTQLIYARTKSPQKGLFLFRKAWNMSVVFSICFYQIVLT